MTATKPAQTTFTPAAVPATLQRIILTGFMGAGKTSVGRLLAEQLGWAFLDLDEHLETRANATIPELFARDGEARFRRIESSALANALSHTHTVIALGGGAPEQLTNRLLLEQTPNTHIIFLDAPFPVLFDRCMLQSFASPDHIRPLLASPEQAEARFLTRQPIYRRLARLTLSTADLTTQQAVDQLLSSLTTEN
ncbi:shikimate kinase [Granulicella tundricola]|uniref:Shikimate kinase n=1 Tax=Granulicella tundricola (strain ATCC BAA-1859 / DSM 23138 / MP5ACTX9) TaxID=1198114 RepID=E8X586_GRATM|nr:shikimate kinase [Granulicella tundricola]ADW68350.1 Shikimate kinase [Granulicella tundricola MP5ACTX9]